MRFIASNIHGCIIQLRSMQNAGTWLPRPRQVCQEPAEASGTMSHYDAALNLFYSIYFPVFNCSLGWVENLVFQDCLTASSVYCDLNEAVTKDNQIFQHPLHERMKAAGWEALWHLCHETDEFIDKLNNIYISGRFFNSRTKLIGSFFKPVGDFIVFWPKIRTDFSSPELGFD